ncbi:Serine/threonine-protein kinase [Ceratobasidium sp. AG-Ba]|nr:Serine/threonine-protein kinase [Ceratobasidium sp. AG-Ba]QRW02297.1 Serine/threonine-protein kinase [Ceratobasidium sp. AG-Ba]
MLPTRRVNTYGRRSTAIISTARLYTPSREKERINPPTSPSSEHSSSPSGTQAQTTRKPIVAAEKSSRNLSSGRLSKNKKENLVAELSALSISSSPVKSRKRKPLVVSSPKIRGSPRQRRVDKRARPLGSVSNLAKSSPQAQRCSPRKPGPKPRRNLTTAISDDSVSTIPGGYPPTHPTRRASPVVSTRTQQIPARKSPPILILSDDSDSGAHPARKPSLQPLKRQHAIIGSPPIRSRLSGGLVPSFHARLSGGAFSVPTSPRPFSPEDDLPSPVDSDDEEAFLDAVAELEAMPEPPPVPLPLPNRTKSEPEPSRSVNPDIPIAQPRPVTTLLSESKIANVEPPIASSSKQKPPLVSRKSMPLAPLKARPSIMTVEIPVPRKKRKPVAQEKPVAISPVTKRVEKRPTPAETPVIIRESKPAERPSIKTTFRPAPIQPPPALQPEFKASSSAPSSRSRPSTVPQVPTRPRPKAKVINPASEPALQSLLSTCSQSEPIDFDAFVATFSTDEVHALYPSSSRRRWRKIGEASYSEVFGLGGVVVKVVPLKMEGPVADMEGPSVSEMEDVEKEISVTRAMGEIQDGFIKLVRAHVVRGSYPQELLGLWDAYKREYGSESIRPDSFSPSQLYALLILPDGGPDLEHYTFVPRTSWRTAFSIFWQVAQTLARAESLVRFEHRDLHWGQILIQNLPKSKSRVKITLIDLGLSRMDTHTSTPWYTEPESEVFEGEGDYQFDVYRMMKAHCSDRGHSWAEYRPLTNVMWLHYLARQLLTAKGLRKPEIIVSRYHTVEDVQAESRACACLVEVEKALSASVESVGAGTRKKYQVATSKASRHTNGTQARYLADADAVIGWGISCRWINE